jgi:FMN phosphatase YigB (HAD superfamily)
MGEEGRTMKARRHTPEQVIRKLREADRPRATGLRVGVLTNGPSELQRHKLAVTGLDGLLDAVAISAFGGLVLR